MIDIYSDRLFREENFEKFAILENSDHQDRYRDGANRVSLDWNKVRSFSKIRGVLRTPGFLVAARLEHDRLNRALRQSLGVGFPISATNLAWRCASFDSARSISRTIFSRSGARRLFIAGRGSAHEAVAAASDAGMTTIELQHGIIAPYHALYHYPGRPVVPYAPDVLLTFGPFWSKAADLPFQTQTVVVGSEDIWRARQTLTSRESKRVVVCSQWTVGQQLLELSVDVAALKPDWEIIFRPHPDEDMRKYEEISAARGPANFRISKADEGLYNLLATAETQIGAYSTTLFEGMALGARTIVANLPGAEQMMQPVSDGDAVFARDAAEIASLLDVAPRTTRADRYFAHPVSSIAGAIDAVSEAVTP